MERAYSDSPGTRMWAENRWLPTKMQTGNWQISSQYMVQWQRQFHCLRPKIERGLQVLQEMLTVKFKNWVKQCGSETVIHDLTQNCWPSSNYAQAYRRAWPRAWMRECTMLKRVFLQSEIHVTSTRNKSQSHSAWPADTTTQKACLQLLIIGTVSLPCFGQTYTTEHWKC